METEIPKGVCGGRGGLDYIIIQVHGRRRVRLRSCVKVEVAVLGFRP